MSSWRPCKNKWTIFITELQQCAQISSKRLAEYKLPLNLPVNKYFPFWVKIPQIISICKMFL